jgi:hypothetical protein
MSKPSQVTVLAEDQRHQQFARRYLERLNYSRHEIVLGALPAGKGAGEQATLKFFEWSRKNASLPQNCLRSLVVAIPEIRRLE